MALNLIDSVKGFFTQDLVTQTASTFGESEAAIQKALSGAIPASLVGILNKTGSGGASNLLSMAKQATDSGLPGNLRSLLGGTGIASLLSMAGGLFGDKLGSVIRSIANFAGVKESSATSVLNMAAPAALSSIGREASAGNMGPVGLVSYLNNQKDSILASVPSGLNLASALGVGSLGEIGNKLSNVLSGISGATRQAASYATTETIDRTKSTGSSWLLPFLLILGLGIGAWYLLGRGCNAADTAASDTDTTTTARVQEPVAPPPPPPRESFMVKLPDGSELNAYRGGIEDKLVAFLNSDWKGIGNDSLKKLWFDFDDLNFEMNSAKLTAESMKQVKNIAAVIKAYPDAKFKIGGYTDKVGNDADNQKLSQQRAEAVTAALKAEGADMKRVAAPEGYGEQFATVPESATDEERRKDRRIAVNVRK